MSAIRKSGPYAPWIAIAIAASLSACNNDTATQSPNKRPLNLFSRRPNPTVIDVKRVDLGTSVGAAGTVNNPSATFKSDDTVFVAVTTERPGHDVELKVKWTYQDDSVVKEITKTVNPIDTLVTDFQLTNVSGWPLGRYKVQVFVNGELAAVTEYRVHP